MEAESGGATLRNSQGNSVGREQRRTKATLADSGCAQDFEVWPSRVPSHAFEPSARCRCAGERGSGATRAFGREDHARRLFSRGILRRASSLFA